MSPFPDTGYVARILEEAGHPPWEQGVRGGFFVVEGDVGDHREVLVEYRHQQYGVSMREFTSQREREQMATVEAWRDVLRAQGIPWAYVEHRQVIVTQKQAINDPFPPKACRDCGVPPGEPHAEECDIAVCWVTGGQRLFHGGEDHDCGQDVWTGRYPGDAECEEFGWYCRWLEDEQQWERCSPSEPGATEDLDRLPVDARWDQSLRRWVRK